MDCEHGLVKADCLLEHCVHHWRIEEINGETPTSLGTCQKCGHTHDFPNFLNPWEDVENQGDVLHWMFKEKKNWYGEYIPMRAIKYT